MTALSKSDLDPFTQQRLADIGERWMSARTAHQRTERLLWLGTIAQAFDDDEIAILNALGYLSPSDRDLMASASRPVRPWPTSSTERP